MKNKTRQNKYIVGLLVSLVVFSAFGLIAKAAGGSFWDKVAQYVGLGIANKVNVPDNFVEEVTNDVTLGANAGTDVYNKMNFHAGFLSPMTFIVPLSWTGGTTTPAGGETLRKVIGSITNTERGNSTSTLLCRDVVVDMQVARGVYHGTFTVGTTTKSGDVSYTASSTASLIASTEVATTSIPMLNKVESEGSDTSEYWRWRQGESIIVTDTFQVANATSATSFTTEGGFTGKGYMMVKCYEE